MKKAFEIEGESCLSSRMISSYSSILLSVKNQKEPNIGASTLDVFAKVWMMCSLCSAPWGTISGKFGELSDKI